MYPFTAEANVDEPIRARSVLSSCDTTDDGRWSVRVRRASVSVSSPIVSSTARRNFCLHPQGPAPILGFQDFLVEDFEPGRVTAQSEIGGGGGSEAVNDTNGALARFFAAIPGPRMTSLYLKSESIGANPDFTDLS